MPPVRGLIAAPPPKRSRISTHLPEMTPEEDEGYNEASKRIRSVRSGQGKGLSLSRLAITRVPVGLGRLSTLTKLLLSHNPLTEVPAEIGRLGALTELDLSHNRLTSVPPEFGQLHALTLLDLSKNQ